MTLPCPTCCHHRGIDDQGTYLCSAGGPVTDQFPLMDAWMDRIMRQGCPGWAQGKMVRGRPRVPMTPEQRRQRKRERYATDRAYHDKVLARSKARYRPKKKVKA